GTNGKTTTAKLIQTILGKSGKKVFQNEGGANLLNGIASSMLLRSSILCKVNYDYAILETDENTLPLILKEIPNPDYILLLNLFRDQLDRYGEVNAIATKWKKAIERLSNKTVLILNADDPQIAYLGSFNHISKAIPIPYRNRIDDKVFYFGLDNKELAGRNPEHASDSTYCPSCGKKLVYDAIYFSHLGDWKCEKCGFKHPDETFTKSPIYPLDGLYNQYNTNAAVLLTKQIGIDEKTINSALHNFKPAFGRQEDLEVNGKKVKIFLSKNPTSFNESLRTITSLDAKNLLIVLNDRIPDGRDVSWIWDVDFEELLDERGFVSVAGDRAYDMALRLKYTNVNINDKQVYTDLKKAISENLKSLNKNEALYILPTYSAMLEVRKILTGKKIL
ncbi:MAG: MurT ligase domain-containing protein, partial [Candidatus Levybacteria bacterium]|nr:MurT ligase domain-containing protein [Candidatus Levybacteria bacterium]